MTLQQGSELEEGFAAFVRAAQRLEERYAALEARTSAIDRELVETNQTLQSTLAEREVVFENLPVGVAAVARDGSLSWSNDEARRLEQILRGSVASWIELEDGLHRFGPHSLRIRRVPLPDQGTLVVGEDRSQVAELEREVDRLDRLAGLSELALGVAHEIKNPLNGVSGYASMMRRATDLDTAQRYGAKVLEGIQKVDEIVREMLAFARPSGHPEILRPLIEVARAAVHESGLGSERITIEGDGLDELVDASVLGRALGNLLRNSCESSALEVAVTIRAQCVPGGLRIEVADDGPGVPEELRSRLFEPFVSQKEGGTGLGLALTARVLSFLGARIALAETDRGAHFVIDLPTTDRGAAK